MLQDISPHHLCNQYKQKQVTPKSTVFHFLGKNVYIARTEDDQLQLPSYGEVAAWQSHNVGDHEADAVDGGMAASLQYLFSIEEEDFFLLMDKEELPQGGLYHYETVRTLRQLVSKEVCFAVMTAWHLYVWYNANRFCGHCGKPVSHDKKERMLRCPNCGNMIFPKIAPAVIVAVLDGDRILMSKYAGRDYKKYALIAGFTEIGETVEETVAREVMEEVGLRVKNIRYYKSQPWGIDSNLLLGFFADLDGDDTICLDENELAEAEWFERDAMPAHDDGISLTREMMGIFEKGLV